MRTHAHKAHAERRETEGQEVKGKTDTGPCVHAKRTHTVLRVDPRRRCIALLVYESKLIIIPIRYSGEGDIDDDLVQVCR